MSDTLSLSIDAANKIRAAMGMALLPGGSAPTTGPAFRDDTKPAAASDDEEPASTIETRSAAAYDNFKKIQDDAAAKKKREERVAAVKREVERASRNKKLEGKGLADLADDAAADDKEWLKSTKKRQKRIAKADQMQAELEERERQAQADMAYTGADLAGVKVGHEVGDFDDAEQILVLEDRNVDEDEDDELVAVELQEKQRLQEKLDSKKRKKAYDPNEVNEAGGFLEQYDEEIDGKKRKAFTLDGTGRTVEQAQQEASNDGKPKRVPISLDILKDDQPANDYMDISEVKIKKAKKSKKKQKRVHVEDEEDMFPQPDVDMGGMDVDEPETFVPKEKKSFFDAAFDDDDDLQTTLAAQRKKALKTRQKKMGRPEDIAKRLREEAPATPDVRDTTEGDEDGEPLVIDETSEFVTNLSRSKSAETEQERRRQNRKTSHVSGTASVGDIESQPVDEEGDVAMQESYAEAAEAEEREEARSREPAANFTTTGLDEELVIDRGLASTLKLLRQRGVIEESNSGDLNTHYRERQKFLADKQKAEADAERIAKEQRERERKSGRWNNMSVREREEWARKNNTSRDQTESRKLAEIFNKEYKPNVQLNYVDDFGRHMNAKEAFKQLSHQFHGKGSGNTKTAKHLAKIANEKKELAKSSLETTLAGTTNAQGQQSKKHKQAGVRLQ